MLNDEILNGIGDTEDIYDEEYIEVVGDTEDVYEEKEEDIK